MDWLDDLIPHLSLAALHRLCLINEELYATYYKTYLDYSQRLGWLALDSYYLYQYHMPDAILEKRDDGSDEHKNVYWVVRELFQDTSSIYRLFPLVHAKNAGFIRTEVDNSGSIHTVLVFNPDWMLRDRKRTRLNS